MFDINNNECLTQDSNNSQNNNIMDECLLLPQQHELDEAFSTEQDNDSRPPKQWTLDDVVLTEDKHNVSSINCRDAMKARNKLSIAVLRKFCLVIPGIGKEYSKESKDNILKMICNRKITQLQGNKFADEIEENKKAMDKNVALKLLRGKKPKFLTS